MERHSSSQAISARIVKALTEFAVSRENANLGRFKTLMFLVSDILFNSVQSTEAWSYVRRFEQAMPLLMLQLNAKLWTSAFGKMSRDKLIKDVRRIFTLWAEKSIFDSRLTTGWLATLAEDKETFVTFLDPTAAIPASATETVAIYRAI